MSITKKIIGACFFVGAILSFCVYFFLTGLSTFFSFLVPNLIAFTVFNFYAIAAFCYLKKPDEGWRVNLFVVTLFMQSLQIEIGGFVFRNFFAPEWTFVLKLNNFDESVFRFVNFHLVIMNGYFGGNHQMQISFNLLILAVISGVFFLTKYKSVNI